MSTYELTPGSHSTAEDGRCAMEWAAHLAGLKHSDRPACVSPMLQEFCISLNDALPDEPRQRLRPYLARTLGTVGDGLDDQRRWLCADWMIRTYVPAWMELVPSLRDRAVAIRDLPPVLAAENVARAMEQMTAARSEAAAAWAAAWDAAGDAARDAARAAARDAARAAARDAAGDAAAAAAWDAAGDAAGDAAWDAAGDAARDAAWDAAGDAARAAAWDAAGDAARAAARAAAGDAAGDALAPTVLKLQNSVLSSGGLLDRMLPTELVQIPVVSEWRAICEVA